MTNIANIFKSIRKELGLTQTEFALSLNVSRSAIAQIETSNNNPSNELVKRLINTHKEIPNNLISKLKSELEFIPDVEKNEKVIELKQNKNNYTKEVLNGVKQFQKTMTSIEFILTILKTRFHDFKKEEVDILRELDELVLSKPFSILLGKSDMSIEDYSAEIDLKSILAEELLHEYIQKLYDVEFDLKDNEFISFNYDNLLPFKDTDFD